MQCNQPLFNTAYECNSYLPIVPKPVQYSKIIGEGDIRQIVLPDGSVQLYIIPANWSGRWPCQFYTNNLNIPYHPAVIPMNVEPWNVRNISYSTPIFENHQFPTGFGDKLPMPQFNSKCCLNPPYTEYTQKFHNDNSTSTTDICYFYPKLRQNSCLRNSAVVQTEVPIHNFYHGATYDGPCYSRTNRVAEKETNYACACKEGLPSGVSFMSVDEEIQRPKQILKNKNTSTSRSKLHKNTKSGHPIVCKCTKDTTDKYVTTYEDQGCGFMVKDGRQTQTTEQKSKRTNIKTDVWTLKSRRKSKNKSKSRCKCNGSCDSFSSCSSASDCVCQK